MDRAKENPKEGFDTPPLSLSPNQNCFNDHQSKCLEICVAILNCNELSVAYRKVKPVLWWILIFKLKQQLVVHIQCNTLQCSGSSLCTVQHMCTVYTKYWELHTVCSEEWAPQPICNWKLGNLSVCTAVCSEDLGEEAANSFLLQPVTVGTTPPPPCPSIVCRRPIAILECQIQACKYVPLEV